MQIVRDVAAKGATVIAVLHDLQAAARWADNVVVMKDGTLYASGAASQAITFAMLRDVYGLDGIVELTSTGELHIGGFAQRP